MVMCAQVFHLMRDLLPNDYTKCQRVFFGREDQSDVAGQSDPNGASLGACGFCVEGFTRQQTRVHLEQFEGKGRAELTRSIISTGSFMSMFTFFLLLFFSLFFLFFSFLFSSLLLISSLLFSSTNKAPNEPTVGLKSLN